MRMKMPITKKNDGWYWGGQGPFDSRDKAEEVAQAAHASGYEKFLNFMKEGDGGGDGGGAIGGFTSADVHTTTYGATSPKKKKLKKELDDVVFTSTETADEALDGGKQKVKEKSGIERVEAFLRDYSPTKSFDKAYGEPYKTEKFDRKQNKRTMQAMEKEGFGGTVATTGMTGDAGTGNSIFTETYGGDSGKRRKKKKNTSKDLQALLNFVKEDLDGDDLTTFTTAYADDGYPEQTENKKKTKKRSGIERAGTFLDDFSPKMEKDEEKTERYKRNRRRHTQELMGTASPTPNTDTIPTHSHQTTFVHKDSLVLDLINYARVELQKEKKAPTATGAGKEPRLMNNDPNPPFVSEADNGRKGIREGISPSKHTPAAQGVDENNVVNMGHAGNFGDGKNTNDVQDDFYSTGRVSKPPKKKKHTPTGAFLATQNTPTQIEAMQKFNMGHIHTTHPTRQQGDSGTIDHPQRTFIEYDKDDDTTAAVQQEDILERVKKHKKAHEERGDDSTFGGFVSAMEKGGAYGMGSWDGQNDSLKRGGDLDNLDDEQELHKRRLARIKDWSDT